MKKMGIVGGISSASTLHYYETLHNLFYNQYHHYYYPEMVIESLNFQYFTDLENENNMNEYKKYILKSFNNLKRAGADFAIMAANSPHSVLEEIRNDIPIPVLSIVDAVGQKAKDLGLKKLLLTGIGYTMRSSFYQSGLLKYGIEVITPTVEEQEIINNIIFSELVINLVSETSKQTFLKIISSYPVDSVILGCTELPQLVSQKDTDLCLLNSLEIHCEETLKYVCDK
ncbi:aspartate/glutamate racemase family protein [Anaerotignum propionicum]|uniref:aspartate/glutamate racemase family protein n=2 Tax=Anaerotignum TaxID=2039240 RepID=UPI00210A8D66|nr:amino acid racemase [Anaerotignum propionicum]MCQ4936504.1 amino acid racemase [Anaerotignum propionicum]